MTNKIRPLTIADIEREPGVSPDTLRIWEQRYGFPEPQRNQSSERNYSHEQLEHLRMIKQLIDRGMRPGKHFYSLTTIYHPEKAVIMATHNQIQPNLLVSESCQTQPTLRLGLCCLFKNEPVKFRTTTARALTGLPRNQQLIKLSEICQHNVSNLLLALETVQRLGIGAFRIMSPLFPRMTHPEVGYSMEQLPDGETILATLETCRIVAQEHKVRLSFHPDQFVVLSSPTPAVVDNSAQELDYHGWLADRLGVDLINIHAGGVYGDKQAALQRLGETLNLLPESVRSRLTLENDDVSYTPLDLLSFCNKHAIPLVYDVHHHRCNPDGLTVEEATAEAAHTWEQSGREQYCHISSPKTGWKSTNPKPHADYINLEDFPDCWYRRTMTVDVEAKAKELAVIRLMKELQAHFCCR